MKSQLKKSERRIKYLTSVLHRPYPNSFQNILTIIESNNYPHRNLYIELFDLLEKKGIDVKDWKQYQEWANQNWQRHFSETDYNAMPNPPKQDNKTYLVGNRMGRNANKIRYPKKCRKTAWKRFYKLFPHLLSKKNELEVK